jgi:hypothetical protein
MPGGKAGRRQGCSRQAMLPDRAHARRIGPVHCTVPRSARGIRAALRREPRPGPLVGGFELPGPDVESKEGSSPPTTIARPAPPRSSTSAARRWSREHLAVSHTSVKSASPRSAPAGKAGNGVPGSKGNAMGAVHTDAATKRRAGRNRKGPQQIGPPARYRASPRPYLRLSVRRTPGCLTQGTGSPRPICPDGARPSVPTWVGSAPKREHAKAPKELHRIHPSPDV